MKFGVAVVPKRVRTACEKCANWTLLADGEWKGAAFRLRSFLFLAANCARLYVLIDKNLAVARV